MKLIGHSIHGDIKLYCKQYNSSTKEQLNKSNLYDFSYKFYIESNETTSIIVSYIKGETTNCTINTDGDISMNIPKDTFKVGGNLMMEYQPIFLDSGFEDKDFAPLDKYSTGLKLID